MKDYWEDRLAAAGTHDKAVAAIEKFRASRKTRSQQNTLYDALTNLGVEPEEADEFINLEMDMEA